MTVPDGTFTNTVGGSKNSIKNSNEYKYVMYMKSELDRKLFPNDFDVWTIQEQCAWMNENIATLFPNVPKSLLDLIPGYFRQDCGRSPVQIPEWLDMDKYRRGQKFARKNFMQLTFAEGLGLINMYTFKNISDPLIISKNSHTPYLVFKRIISTLKRGINWNNGEPWIRGTRKLIRTCSLESKIMDPWCLDRELLLKDFTAAYPLEKDGQRPYVTIDKSPYKLKGVTNTGIAYIQCCITSFVILCPQNVGIHNVTNEDIEAFCHLCRCYGYCLGIEDEHNFCRGSLEEIKQRTRDLYQYWVLPNLKDVTPEWEHMIRCFVAAFNFHPLIYMPFKVIILLAMDVFNINMPHLYASMNYTEWIAYKSWRFIFRYVMKVSIFEVFVNMLTRKIFDQLANLSPTMEAEFQKKSETLLLNLSIKN